MDRKRGIDLLRVVSMLMIVTLHTLGQGGVLDNCAPGSTAYGAAWLLEVLAYCGVNCFGMISGYVGVHSRFKAGRGLELWLRVLFYTVSVTALFSFLVPGSVTGADWTSALLPVTTKQYWYVSSYFIVFFFAPFINRMLLALDRRRLILLGLACFVITTIWAPLGMNEVLPIQAGYSALWLGVLYVFGGILRLLDAGRGLKKWQLIGIYLLSALGAWGWKILTEAALSGVLPAKLADMFITYTSPAILLCAMALLLLFEKIDLRAPLAVRLTEFLSPLAFGVYLIHTQKHIWGYLVAGRFADFAQLPWPLTLLSVLAAAAVIYLACALIDAAREALFKLLGVDKLGKKTTEFFENKFFAEQTKK